MNNTLKVSIISPTALVYQGEAAMVEVPGVEGDMGVLAGHAPTLSQLRAGVVVVHGADRGYHSFDISGGYADISPENCTVLAEQVSAA